MLKKGLWVVLFALGSSVVHAGLVQPADTTVIINPDGSGFASGDMVTARFAPSDSQMIGCGQRTFAFGDGSSFAWGFCQARDAAGAMFACFTEDPHLLNAMHATSAYAFLIFRWNGAGECVHVGSSTQSFYIPEFRDKKK